MRSYAANADADASTYAAISPISEISALIKKGKNYDNNFYTRSRTRNIGSVQGNGRKIPKHF
jgi:hypothetical protein